MEKINNLDDKKLKIAFCSGADNVTGANYFIEIKGKRILVDCGLIQGSRFADPYNWRPFPYDPKTVDYLFITHGHIDHIGRIPKLIYEGFKGKIYSTPPTKDITGVMLLDSNGIICKESETLHLEDMYNDKNVASAMSLWETVPYKTPTDIGGGIKFKFLDSGHILGSAMVEFEFDGTKIVFTGDLGNSPSPLLPDTEEVTDANYLVMESVYGDRVHERRNERKDILERALEEGYKKKSTILIPVFSLERAQELLFELDDLIENLKIPSMPVFFDSPLAIKLTPIFSKYKDYFKPEVMEKIAKGESIFSFPGLKITALAEESMRIQETKGPKIIIAGSGMSTGGRIIHHEKLFLPDPNNIILLTGYQSVGSLGRKIQEGAKTVFIGREPVPVKAKVITIHGYSGHKDTNGLFDFVSRTKDTLKRVFVVMGEPKSQMFLAQRLKDYLGLYASSPKQGEIFILDL